MGRVIQTLHSGFTVANVREIARFFRECLGFETTDPHMPPSEMLARIVGIPGAEAQIVYVTTPDHMIELLEYKSPISTTRAAPRPCDIGFAHLAFLVDDVTDVAEAASAYGFAVLTDIPRIETGRSAGRRATYLRDPAGFTIELMGG